MHGTHFYIATSLSIAYIHTTSFHTQDPFYWTDNFVETNQIWVLWVLPNRGEWDVLKKRFKIESKLEDKDLKGKYKHKYKYLIKSPVALPVHHRDEVGVSARSSAIGQAFVEIPRKSIGCGNTRVHFDFWGNNYLGSTT